MQHLLPQQGQRLIEIGAGFGRLADLYAGYNQVVLTDYARTQLQEAQAYLDNDPRFTYVVADVYNLPFVDHLFDTLTMVRVMHHLTDVPAALTEIQRVIRPRGTAIIEHASKLHLKSLARWALGRQGWSPFEQTPVEFVELNFNFHPAWMRHQFKAAGFQIKKVRTLSHFRAGPLKKLLPTSLLVTLDSWVQPSGNWWPLAPSLFLQATAQKTGATAATGFFRCPRCKSAQLSKQTQAGPQNLLLVCQTCRIGWSLKEGIYDFKTPVALSEQG